MTKRRLEKWLPIAALSEESVRGLKVFCGVFVVALGLVGLVVLARVVQIVWAIATKNLG